jgi:DNA polymerase sigma
MIKRYCDIVPVLRPMVAFIKRWAKPLGLNSPSTAKGAPTFSSYAFMLMTIAYLQVSNPSVLNFDESTKSVQTDSLSLFHAS